MAKVTERGKVVCISAILRQKLLVFCCVFYALTVLWMGVVNKVAQQKFCPFLRGVLFFFADQVTLTCMREIECLM